MPGSGAEFAATYKNPGRNEDESGPYLPQKEIWRGKNASWAGKLGNDLGPGPGRVGGEGRSAETSEKNG